MSRQLIKQKSDTKKKKNPKINRIPRVMSIFFSVRAIASGKNTLKSQEGDWSCVGHAKLLSWRRFWNVVGYGLLNTCPLTC